MSSPIFLDTLFVVALVNRRDQYHQQAAALAEQFHGDSLLVTDAVLLEIGNALARSFKSQAIHVIGSFLSAPDVSIAHLTPFLFDQAFELYKSRPDKEWGLVDCLSFVVMRGARSSQALTFDRHFEQAGFQMLMEPISA